MAKNNNNKNNNQGGGAKNNGKPAPKPAPVVKADLKGKPGSGVTKVNPNKPAVGGGKNGNTKPVETNKQQITNLESKLRNPNLTPEEYARVAERIKFLGGKVNANKFPPPQAQPAPVQPVPRPTSDQPTSGTTTPPVGGKPKIVEDVRAPERVLPPNSDIRTNEPGDPNGVNVTGMGQVLPGGNMLPPAPPDMGAAPVGTPVDATNAAKINDPGSMLNADMSGEKDESLKQIGYQNPDQYNDLGSQTTRVNPDGSITQVQNRSEDQKRILDQDEQISQAGRDIATSQIGNFAQPWEAQTADREFQGDFGADRMRMEDAVYKNLTRDNAENKKREREDIERTMFNRGISLDPRNEQYAKTTGDLDKRYDRMDEAARLNATQYGGDELARRFGQQEQLIANQFSQQQAGRNQQLGEVSTFANMGPGQQTAQYQGYSGPNYDVNDPSSYVYGARDYKEGNQNQQIQKNQFNQQMDLSRDTLGQQMAMQERAIAAAKSNVPPAQPPPFPGGG